MKSDLFSMRLCRDYPGRLAIVGNGASCTYEDMHKGIHGLARRLREMGVGQGSRVALWSYNSANWLIAFFAIVRAGGTAVLVNYSMSAQDAAELLNMTDTAFLLCGDNGETKKDPNAMERLAALAGIPETHCLDIRPSARAVHPPGRGGDAHRAHHGRLFRRRGYPGENHPHARMAAGILQRPRGGVFH